MAAVKLFWDPAGFELDSLGNKSFERITDGDTPYVSISIRMLSIDTPEVHYPGNSDPANHDERLGELALWLQTGQAPVGDDFAAYLRPKLADGRAGSRQKQQGEAATAAFQRLLDERLARPNGRRRSLFLRAGDERFDAYGRLLAYISPAYSEGELAEMSYAQRATFNLLMVEEGWAASFPIYPSLPKFRDLVMLHDAAEAAFMQQKGAWAEPNTLTGYEFRMAYKLWQITARLVRGEKLSGRERHAWIERYCADMTTREIAEPENYYRIPPYNRVFIWPRDVNDAVGKLNLEPSA